MIHVLESTKWKDHQRCERRAIQLICFFSFCSFSLENLFEYVTCIIIRLYCLNGVPFVKIVSGKKGENRRKKTECEMNTKLSSGKVGDAGYRSRYLSHAKRALFHLSYTPRQESHSRWQYPSGCNIYIVLSFLQKIKTTCLSRVPAPFW